MRKASGLSPPITMRSGSRKSLTADALHALGEFGGLLTTCTWAATGLLLEEVDRACGSYPPGTVDFTTIAHHVVALVLGQRVADFLAGPFEVAHVDGAVRLGRGADGQEDDLGVLRGVLDVVGELQRARGIVLLHQFLQARLEDRAVAVLEHLELFLVLLGAAHCVADAGQTGRRHQTDISTTDDRNVHCNLPLSLN